MSDTGSAVDDSKEIVIKDKKCQFCQQSFTSSSLGRHLDLYIKEKNPKAPDGIHDVAEIRKIREHITRRQPKNSSARSRRGDDRDGSILSAARSPSASGRKSPKSELDRNVRPGLRSSHGSGSGGMLMASPSMGRNPSDNSLNDEAGGTHSQKTQWQNNPRVISHVPSVRSETSQEIMRGAYGSPKPGSNIHKRRSFDKQSTAKANHDQKQHIKDLEDEVKAGHLALREVLGAVKAANMRIDQSASPFDYDPTKLDFPALTLYCLEPPPTLHAIVPFATSNSWAIEPPGEKQYNALKSHFESAFRQWRVKESVSIQPKPNDYTWPPPPPIAGYEENTGEEKVQQVRLAVVKELEIKISSHVRNAYSTWQSLPVSHKAELWVVELARSVGRKANMIKECRTAMETLLQENEHLREQVEQLSRCQQPREFQMMPPSTIAMSAQAMLTLGEWSLQNAPPGIGLNLADKELDLGDLVKTSVARWKKLVQQKRQQSLGMANQRELSSGMGNLMSRGPALFDPTRNTTKPEPKQNTSNTPGVDLSMPDVQGEEDADGETEDEHIRDTQEAIPPSQYDHRSAFGQTVPQIPRPDPRTEFYGVPHLGNSYRGGFGQELMQGSHIN